MIERRVAPVALDGEPGKGPVGPTAASTRVPAAAATADPGAVVATPESPPEPPPEPPRAPPPESPSEPPPALLLEPVPEKPDHTANWALASLSLSMLLSSLGTSIANVALPTLAEVFSAPFQQVQWVVLAYLLAVATVIVSVGRLGDLTGRRRLLVIGIGLFTTASALAAVAPTLALLIAARALQGLGAAIMMALTMALVGDAVGRDRIGRAMGLLGTMSALGTALGPSLGGVLIAGFGWPALFLCNLPLGLLALVLAQRFLPADRRAQERPLRRDRDGAGKLATAPRARTESIRFDVQGTLLLAATLLTYALAMTMGRGHFGAVNWLLLTLAGAGVVLFARTEARATDPLIRLALLRDPILGGGFAMSALVTTVVMATLVVGPFYLTDALGLTAVRVGAVLSAGPVIAALVGVPAGRLVDRFGAQPLTVVGLSAMFAGCVALPLLPTRFAVPGYLAPLVVITAGYALFQAANNTAVMQRAGAAQRGVVSGLLNLARNLGLITGAAMMGAVFAFATAGAEAIRAPAGGARSELATGAADALAIGRAEAVAVGMRVTFAFAAILIAGALAVAFAGRLRRVVAPDYENEAGSAAGAPSDARGPRARSAAP